MAPKNPMPGVVNLFSLIGIALCGLVGFGMGQSILYRYRLNKRNLNAFRTWQQNMRSRLDARQESQKTPLEPGRWDGWRAFRVNKLQRESADSTSIYLEAVDGKAIADFKPGQHLTIRVPHPGSKKPAVRCYSLSDAPADGHYRITVKKKPMPEEAIGKSVSHFINDMVMEGDVFEIKAPNGEFYLDASESTPVVLLAAGVGITPMFSMVRTLAKINPQRQVVLCYGNQDSRSHIYKDEISKLQQQLTNFHVLNCYSAPTREDVEQQRFHSRGYVSIDILKQILPHKKFQFFMCGPPAFMDSLFHGLMEWGIPESRIHFEAFGPATVSKLNTASTTATQTRTDQAEDSQNPRVSFRHGDEEPVEGEGVLGTILEIAEELNVELEYGCRAGNCGTCAIRLLKGKVKYPAGMHPDVEQGFCLACIASPDGEVEVEA
ncbi:MAG: 2Fe-2S iron-sulfur cluster-binding protein [Pirellulaceae bacterium]